MKHFSEEELIAYQLHESQDENAISRHLESCSECADLSESIAETLRVFSADPVPQPNLEHNWQRLRGNLGVLTPQRSRGFEFLRWGWAWPVANPACLRPNILKLLDAVTARPAVGRIYAQEDIVDGIY